MLRLALLAICVTAAALPAFAAPSSKMLSVAVNEANFRKGPSTQHEILFSAIRHYPVRELKRIKDWVLVEDFEGEQGWVAARLVTRKPAVIVRVNRANMRAKPTVKAAVVHKAERGEVYRVTGKKGRWLKLSAGEDLNGWLRGDLAWGATRRR